MAPIVSKIRIYPVKSLDGVELDHVEMGHRSLLGDRVFAMVDAQGQVINGKRTGLVNQLRTTYDLSAGLITLNGESFHLVHQRDALAERLSDHFGQSVSLVYRNDGSLLDIPDDCAVSVVSEASLIALWPAFPELTLENFRSRFRVNLEISGTEPFWEDTLFGVPDEPLPYRIGDVRLLGISPRDRCNVPPRDPHTGEQDKTFVKRFVQRRKDTLHDDTALHSYGALYKLTVNTFIPDSERGRTIALGDEVTLGH